MKSGEVCNRVPIRTNNKGELVTPPLFDAIMDYTNGRLDISNNLFYATTSDLFIERYRPVLKFDEDGDPTFSSLKEIPAVMQLLDVDDKLGLDNLSKNLKDGVYKYKEAVELMAAFNRRESINESYMCIIDLVGVGQFKLRVVENTLENRLHLRNFFREQGFEKEVLGLLASMGVKVEEFVDAIDGIGGMFSTEPDRYLKYFDVLYSVIQIATEKPGSLERKKRLEVFKEEIGHLIVGIAKNTESNAVVFDRFYRSTEKMLGNDKSKEDLKILFMKKMGITADEAEEIIKEIDLAKDYSTEEAMARILALYLEDPKIPILSSNNTVNSLVSASFKFAERLWNSLTSVLKLIGNGIIAAYNVVAPSSKSLDYFNIAAAWNKTKCINAADVLVRRFLTEDLGSVEDALGTPETRYHAAKADIEALHEVTKAFNEFRTRMMTLRESRKFDELVKGDIAAALSRKRSLDESGSQLIFSSVAAIASMMESAFNMMELARVGELAKLLELNLAEAVAENRIPTLPIGHTSICIGTLLNTLHLCDNISTLVSKLIQAEPELSKVYELPALLNILLTLTDGVRSSIERNNEALVMMTLASINGGSYYIREVKRRGWFGRSFKEREPVHMSVLLKGYSADTEIDNEGRLLFTTEDATKWGLYLQRMGYSSSVINQFISNLYDFNKAEANKEMDHYSQALMQWYEKYKLITRSTSTSKLCEVMTVDGVEVLTGNMVLPKYNFGLWERDYEDFITKSRAEFKKKYSTEKLNEVEIYLLWKEWFNPKFEAWHQEHSTVKQGSGYKSIFKEEEYDLQGAMKSYIPNEKYGNGKYLNDLYDKLTEDEKILLQEYAEIKQSLDEALRINRRGSVVSWRLPLFRGTVISRLRNNLLNEEVDEFGNTIRTASSSKRKRVFRELGDIYFRNFFIDCNDSDFGDLSTYNNIDDSFFDLRGFMTLEYAKRIPVFGVNKLKDMHNLSTDLVYSTMQYAAMAINVNSLNTINRIIRNGESIFSLTVVGRSRDRFGRITDLGRKNSLAGINDSNNFRRYHAFMEMNFYGLYSHIAPVNTPGVRKFTLRKVINNVNSTLSKFVLSGRVAGGTVNTGTGMLLVLREGMVGQFYDMDSLRKAFAIYNKYVFQSKAKGEFATLNRLNKMYTFIRYFDVLNENDTYFRHFTAHINSGLSLMRLLNYFMWVYSTGNHFNMCLPYIARAINTPMYRIAKEGEEHKDTDIIINDKRYVLEGNVWDNFDEGLLLRGLNVEEHKKKNGRDYVNTDPSIKGNVRRKKRTASGEEINDDVTESEHVWGNPYQTVYFIKADNGDMIEFDRHGQSLFLTLCRYMCDNMHGIYNNNDSMAIQREWYGNLFLTMKKYIFGYVDTLFLSDRYSVADRTNIEGIINTLAKVITNTTPIVKGYKWYTKSLSLVLNKAEIEEFLNNNRIEDTKEFQLKFVGGLIAPLITEYACMGLNSLALICIHAAIAPILQYLIGKGITESAMKSGYSKWQAFNIKRAMALTTIRFAIHAFNTITGYAAFAHDDDDYEEFRKELESQDPKVKKNALRLQKIRKNKNGKIEPIELEIGELIDAFILDKIGYHTYAKDLNKAIVDSHGNIRRNPKTPGILFTMLSNMNDPKDPSTNRFFRPSWWEHNMERIFYVTARLEIENGFLSPYLGGYGFEEFQNQFGEMSNIVPLSISKILEGCKFVREIDEEKKIPKEYQDVPDKDFWLVGKDVYNNNEVGLDMIVDLMRSYEYWIAGENKGMQYMINQLPYFNTLKPWESGYEAHKSFQYNRNPKR